MWHETHMFTKCVLNSLVTSLRPQKNGGEGTIFNPPPPIIPDLRHFKNYIYVYIIDTKLILNIKHYDIPGDSPKNHLLTYLWQDYNNLCHDPLWNQEALSV